MTNLLFPPPIIICIVYFLRKRVKENMKKFAFIKQISRKKNTMC